ncbi:DUF202 domain-containing protein [Streptomyces sp. NPDC051940]|uniref:YidH family protein n=1 Tax=Streptomyces sp. NPDC051940 TaxID=3155675 RepID=UPI003428ADBA
MIAPDRFSSLRLWFDPAKLRSEGTTPDYRFSLANERTFLAWIRTALALVGGGLAADQFLTDLDWAQRTTIALVLLAIGALCAVRAVNHWVSCERAMRRGEDLPASRFPAALAVATALSAVLILVIVLTGKAGK